MEMVYKWSSEITHKEERWLLFDEHRIMMIARDDCLGCLDLLNVLGFCHTIPKRLPWVPRSSTAE